MLHLLCLLPVGLFAPIRDPLSAAVLGVDPGVPRVAAAQQRGGNRGQGNRTKGAGRPPGAPTGGKPAGPGGARKAGGAAGGGLPPLLYPPSKTPAPLPAMPADEPLESDKTPKGNATPLGELPELADLEIEYFQIADYDGNQWISFREAVASMDVDRGEFRSFDPDRDGRIDAQEFGDRVRETVGLVGSFRPPRPFIAPRKTPDVSETMLESVDLDSDGALSVFELQAVFESFNAPDLDAQLVLSSFDGDLSGNLDAEEFSDIARSLREGTFAIAPAPAEVPTSIDELFGVPVPRRTLPGTASSTLPPRLVGPVTHFHRLDFDRDGQISPDDLLRLQAPLHLEVRARAIVAFLDLDGDGSLDRDEVQAAFE